MPFPCRCRPTNAFHPRPAPARGLPPNAYAGRVTAPSRRLHTLVGPLTPRPKPDAAEHAHRATHRDPRAARSKHEKVRDRSHLQAPGPHLTPCNLSPRREVSDGCSYADILHPTEYLSQHRHCGNQTSLSPKIGTAHAPGSRSSPGRTRAPHGSEPPHPGTLECFRLEPGDHRTQAASARAWRRPQPR